MTAAATLRDAHLTCEARGLMLVNWFAAKGPAHVIEDEKRLLEVNNLHVHFPLDKDHVVKAVRGVSFPNDRGPA